MGSPPENPQDSGISLTHPLRPTTLPPPRCQTPRRQAVRTAMFHGTRPGWIEVIAGVMFSGKSEELVRRVRRAVIARKHVQVFKSHLDARYAGLYTVSTHDGGTVEAEPVDSSEGVVRAVRPDTEVVAVDEVQFLDDGIVAVANGLADRGVRTDAHAPRRRRDRRQAPGDLRRVRRAGQPQPASRERTAGSVGKPHHHG